jgi:hypothetical protein
MEDYYANEKNRLLRRFAPRNDNLLLFLNPKNGVVVTVVWADPHNDRAPCSAYKAENTAPDLFTAKKVLSES